jgi:hypothetical protein
MLKDRESIQDFLKYHLYCKIQKSNSPEACNTIVTSKSATGALYMQQVKHIETLIGTPYVDFPVNSTDVYTYDRSTSHRRGQKSIIQSYQAKLMCINGDFVNSTII